MYSVFVWNGFPSPPQERFLTTLQLTTPVKRFRLQFVFVIYPVPCDLAAHSSLDGRCLPRSMHHRWSQIFWSVPGLSSLSGTTWKRAAGPWQWARGNPKPLSQVMVITRTRASGCPGNPSHSCPETTNPHPSDRGLEDTHAGLALQGRPGRAAPSCGGQARPRAFGQRHRGGRRP